MSGLKPPALQPDDTIAAISLSSGAAARYPQRYQTGKRQFGETFGVRVIETPNALRDDAWLHDNPQARADDLHWALTNDRVTGIVSTIGGDESIRTVPYLDLNLIRENPKAFVGFSDATVQHLVHRQAGVVSFYGPSLLTCFAETGGIRPYVESAVRAALFASATFELTGSSECTEEHIDWGDTALATRRRRWWPNPGWAWLQGDAAVEGELIGGNTEILEMAKATSLWPPDTAWDGAVMLLETSEEAPAPQAVKHWLRSYLASGVLHRIGALLIARPIGYTQQAMFQLWDNVEAVLAEAGRGEMPVVANVDYGHSSPQGVIPLGCRARVDPSTRSIRMLESGVARRSRFVDDVTKTPHREDKTVDPLVAHQRAQDVFAGVLANVGPDQLGAPTPCSEWTIGDLIEHVIGGNEYVGRWAGSPVEPPARPDDMVAAHQTAASAAQQIFAEPDGMSTMFNLPFGQLPGQLFVGIRTADVLTHAWDLAAASGQSTDLDPELATEQLAAARAFVGPQFRGPDKPFRDEQPCSSERSPADQLAAFLGRKVQ